MNASRRSQDTSKPSDLEKGNAERAIEDATRLARKMSSEFRHPVAGTDWMNGEARKSPHFLLALILMLDYSDDSVRTNAMHELIRQDPRLARVAARALAFDPVVGMRCAASSNLSQRPIHRDAKLFLAFVSDPEWTVRSDGVESLCDLDGRRFAPVIRKVLLTDRHPVVRRDAAVSLARATGEECVPLLLELLATEKELPARTGLLYALDVAGHPDAFDWWLDLLPSLGCLDQCYTVANLRSTRSLRAKMDRVLQVLARPEQEWDCYGAFREAQAFLVQLDVPSEAVAQTTTVPTTS